MMAARGSPSSARWLRRLYRMRLLTGVLASLPAVTLAAYYGASAYAQLERHRRASGEPLELVPELLQIAVHDALTRDLRRLALTGRESPRLLRVVSLRLPPSSLDHIMSGGTAEEVPGRVLDEGEVVDVEVRRRGAKPWHRLGRQKSLRVQAESGELIAGARVFNLVNDPSPFGLESYVVLDLARELGLLAAASEPVRLRLNDTDLGVYRYEASPDEGLLRRSRRMPASLYSGDLETAGGRLGLFGGTEGWKKVAWRDASERADLRELEGLLAAVQSASHTELARYAERAIDLDRYALFDALDVVFGGKEHDWTSNHKLYFDPYTGKMEPVAWAFDAFRHEPRLNLVDHPLLLRLKLVPGYLERRNRWVYALLTGAASAAQVRRRVEQRMRALAPELRADAFWDANGLLPDVSDAHRALLRPMTPAKWSQAARAELAAFTRRSRFLLDELERAELSATLAPGRGGRTRIAITAGHEASYALREITLAAPCTGSYLLAADLDGDGRIDRDEPVVARARFGETVAATLPTVLAPGLRLVPRSGARRHGTVRAEREARVYELLVRAGGCAPEAAQLVLESVVTGAMMRIDAERGARDPTPQRGELPSPRSVPALEAGERSPHPWDLEVPPPARTLALGPGLERIDATRYFSAAEVVVIAPGTSIELAPSASLVFAGRVHAAGTRARPISISPADPAKPFGAVVLLGEGTRGSRLEHVSVSGGAGTRLDSLEAPGILNLHATGDIRLSRVTLSQSSGTELLHAAYVDDLVLDDVVLGAAAVDALDLELTTAEVRNLRVFGAGDDCVDLMGSRVRLSHTAMSRCANNGISAGEETSLDMHDVYVGHASTAVLAKNASSVRAVRLVLFHADVGLQAKHRELHYDGDSRIDAVELYAVSCRRLADEERGARVAASDVRRWWPSASALSYLRGEVLGVTRWSDLVGGPLAVTVEEVRP